MTGETRIADLINAVVRLGDEVARLNDIVRHRNDSYDIVATSTTTAERKREYDRNRQRLVRSGEWNDSRTTSKPTIYIEDTNTNTKKERKSGSLCPNDFRPTQSHYEAGILLGLSASAVDSLCDEMRAWSHTNANRHVARKADWGLALHGWIRRQHGNVAAPNKPATPVTDEEYARLKAKYDAKVARTA